MNEKGEVSSREHDVGGSGQVLAVQPEAIAQAMQQRTDDQFGLGVLALHLLHQVAASIGVEAVYGASPDRSENRRVAVS